MQGNTNENANARKTNKIENANARNKAFSCAFTSVCVGFSHF